MYDNIGGKIKGLAKATFIVEAIAAVISGIAVMAIDEEMILIGLLVMVIATIVAWVSSWFLFGFGQLIENSDIIAKQYKRKNEKHEKSISESNERKRKQRYNEIKAIIADDSVNENKFIDFTCPNCRQELCYTKAQLQSDEILTCPMCDAPISFK